MRSWIVHPGEKLLLVGRPAMAAVWPRYLLTAGLYGLWHKRNVVVLTDRRIFTGRGVLSRSERSIPLRTVRGSMYLRHGLLGYCDFDSEHDAQRRHTRLGPLAPGVARRLADEIETRI